MRQVSTNTQIHASVQNVHQNVSTQQSNTPSSSKTIPLTFESALKTQGILDCNNKSSLSRAEAIVIPDTNNVDAGTPGRTLYRVRWTPKNYFFERTQENEDLVTRFCAQASQEVKGTAQRMIHALQFQAKAHLKDPDLEAQGITYGELLQRVCSDEESSSPDLTREVPQVIAHIEQSIKMFQEVPGIVQMLLWNIKVGWMWIKEGRSKVNSV